MRVRRSAPGRPVLRRTAALAAVSALTMAATACGGGSSTGDEGSNKNPGTLTYWATNQGSSLEHDKKVLTPELKKFEKETGIDVKLEVVPWDSLLDRILAATSSGQGPDVLNIGNTWSASLQATGALLPWDAKNLKKIGGKDRFTPSALAAAGAEGKPPAAVPLYSLAYGLYYNKQMFKDAGIAKPPETWDELVDTGKKLTGDGKYGLAVEGGNPVENAHHAFVFGKQHGADFFDSSGEPTFDKPANVKAVKQYVDFLASDGIAAEGNAEYAKNESVRDFATGKAGMLLWQAAASSLKSHGMKPDEYGVAPVPAQSADASGERAVNTMVAGINLAVFKNTDNLDGALKFVKFMTSTEEQKALNGTYGSIPPVKEAQQDAAFSTPDLKVLRDVLANSSAPLPQVPDESKFETLVGTAMKELFAEAASGKSVSTGTVQERLTEAQQQMQK
ncbi:sugar ABC transporter substrate-binding protein [Streptomyces armeniacus]|uniref:Sugar ABC transporter substrate-binding protein n=1 Tax=Streptomyces armeniacus TaxID=83291 RepID=A0A345XI44_9ACTN|nr:sugar ABC transporter substrate-binding protein [Streptomyces armeniacus]AXK31310.1 sugar ABC transporter substrate-binding protein [Streptomyces armeniacus]